MILFRFFLVIAISSSFFGYFTYKVEAQSLSIPAQIPEITEQIYVKQEPELPGPNTDVKIRLEAYGTDLTRADITWSVNGTVAKTGRGETLFETNSGNVGTSKKISVVILPVGGVPVRKTITIAPQEIDLVWEARTYTPPFYKGKALPTYQSDVVVEALPNFFNVNGSQRIPPSSLTYTWRKEGNVVQDSSGYGRNYIAFSGSILLRPAEIMVEVKSDTKESARALFTLPYYEPEVLVYEKSPLYGVLFNKSISDGIQKLDNQEVAYEVYPAYFSTLTKKNSLMSYEWAINNTQIYIDDTESSLVFRNINNVSGRSEIKVNAKHEKNFLQNKKTVFTVEFKKQGENLFGF